jgi:hypothetical protein
MVENYRATGESKKNNKRKPKRQGKKKKNVEHFSDDHSGKKAHRASLMHLGTSFKRGASRECASTSLHPDVSFPQGVSKAEGKEKGIS